MQVSSESATLKGSTPPLVPPLRPAPFSAPPQQVASSAQLPRQTQRPPPSPFNRNGPPPLPFKPAVQPPPLPLSHRSVPPPLPAQFQTAAGVGAGSSNPLEDKNHEVHADDAEQRGLDDSMDIDIPTGAAYFSPEGEPLIRDGEEGESGLWRFRYNPQEGESSAPDLGIGERISYQ